MQQLLRDPGAWVDIRGRRSREQGGRREERLLATAPDEPAGIDDYSRQSEGDEVTGLKSQRTRVWACGCVCVGVCVGKVRKCSSSLQQSQRERQKSRLKPSRTRLQLLYRTRCYSLFQLFYAAFHGLLARRSHATACPVLGRCAGPGTSDSR
jgi:hypothetical protein